jgi:molybdopterin-containing oxidoreductase family iron-sulfur binding subunit
MHCDNAPCVKVCPVGARFKEKTGLVATDWGRCIGCRYCEVACPYGVNYANWKDPKKNQYLEWDDQDLKAITDGKLPYANPDLEGRYGEERRKIAGGNHMKGVIEKCTFCVHRLEKGLQPACVSDCPAFALHFGDLDDPGSEVSKLLQAKNSFRLEEGLDTRPRVHYVGGAPPSPEVRQIETIRAKE